MIVAGSAAAALLLAVGAYLFFGPKPASRPDATQTPAPSVTPDNIAALQRRYEDARRQVVEGKHDAAAKTLTRLSTDAQNRQPLASWVRLHRGLALLLQGQTAPARDAFRELEKLGDFGKAKGDAELARFFTETGRMLAAPGPIRGPAAEVNPTSPDALAVFLFGVKNWQIGEFDEAAAHFERFTNTAATGDFGWINDYKPIARTFLEDHRVYAEWKQSPHRPTAPGDIRSALATLRALEGRVKTRGALVDTLKTEAKRLNAELGQREKAEKQAQERELQRLREEQAPLWTAALAEARRRAGVYDFAGAVQAVDAAGLTEPSLKEAQATARKRFAWLVDWKMILINDLRTGRYMGRIGDQPGVEYEGVASATQDEITLRVPGGGEARPVKWTALKPQTLLEMSRAFVAANAAEAADRQWLAAVFAHETGQSEAATQLADAAVKGKPAYREQLGALKAAAASAAR